MNVLQLLVSNKSMSSGITSLSWPCWSRGPVVTTVASPGSCWGNHHRPALAPVTHWLAPALPLSLCRSRSQSPLSRHSLHSRLLLPTSLLTLVPDTRHKTLTHQNLRKENRGQPTRKDKLVNCLVQRRFLELCLSHNFRQRYFTLYFIKIIHWLPRSVPVQCVRTGDTILTRWGRERERERGIRERLEIYIWDRIRIVTMRGILIGK